MFIPQFSRAVPPESQPAKTPMKTVFFRIYNDDGSTVVVQAADVVGLYVGDAGQLFVSRSVNVEVFAAGEWRSYSFRDNA